LQPIRRKPTLVGCG